MGVLNAALCSLFGPDVFSFPHLNATIKRANTRLSVRLISPLRHSFQISEKSSMKPNECSKLLCRKDGINPFRLSNPPTEALLHPDFRPRQLSSFRLALTILYGLIIQSSFKFLALKRMEARAEEVLGKSFAYLA